MIICIIRPYAAYGRIGWWVSMRRALFSLLYRKTLNIGRVQTPTLALLCDRHNKISYFQKEKYFTAVLDLDGVKAETTADRQ